MPSGNRGQHKTMNKITINGITIEVSGNNVSIINGELKVDGVSIKTGLSGNVNIKWEGELASLDTTASVQCGDVKGNVDAGGSVTCGNVGGSVDCGGSCTADNITGNIDAGGSVHIKR